MVLCNQLHAAMEPALLIPPLPNQPNAIAKRSGNLYTFRRAARTWPAVKVLSASLPCCTSATQPSSPTEAASRSPTLYEFLQLSPDATAAQIKASYRRLARLYHPDASASPRDKNHSATLFRQIHSAYTALSDTATRSSYDLYLSAQAMSSSDYSVSSAPRASALRNRSFTTAASASGSSATATCKSSSFASLSGKVGRNWETDQCW
ncbi:hypothetical protein KP509_1Z073800 [Ceratopteris richardii]|nr:hypothetical protein KP509_1Z073800 [Ceratopteris richardii]